MRDRGFDELGVGGIPGGVATKAEALGHQQGTARRRHLGAPVRRLVQSSEGDVLFRKIYPGLIGRARAIEHHRHDHEIAIAHARRHRAHLGRRVRLQRLNQARQRNGGEKLRA
jgi:hypothetical protein